MAESINNLPANAGDIRDAGLSPGLGRSPGRRNSNPLQYSCLENPKDRGTWWTIVHGITESDTTERLNQYRSCHCKQERNTLGHKKHVPSFCCHCFSLWLLALREASCCVEFFISDIIFFTFSSFIWSLYLPFLFSLCLFSFKYPNIVIIVVLSFLSTSCIISIISESVSVDWVFFCFGYSFSCFLVHFLSDARMLHFWVPEFYSLPLKTIGICFTRQVRVTFKLVWCFWKLV